MAYRQAYPPQGYPPQGYHQFSPPPPQEPPYHQFPVEAFRAFFVYRLTELTFNSRPIIVGLTSVATREKESGLWENVQVIVHELADAIYRAPPHGKLPLLYLLDSISKICGEPYTNHYFPDIMPDLFLNAYHAVDAPTRGKMEDMVKTWAASYDKPELYPRHVRDAVERGMYGQLSTPSHVGNYPSHDQVKQALQATLHTKQKAVAINPANTEAATQISVLIQINNLLDSGVVTPPERAQIMDQMQEMNSVPPSVSVPAPAPGLGLMPGFGVQPGSGSVATFRGGFSPRPGAIATPPPAPAVPGMDMNNILSSLNNLKNANFTNSPRFGTPDSATNDLPAVETVQPDSLEAYEELILSLNVQLNMIDLNKSHGMLPFAHLPKRCAICAARFPDGQAGLAALSEHMDWHYRRNNQQNQNSGRGGYRRWLPKADDWVNDLTASYSHNAEAGPSTLNPNTTAGRAAAKAQTDQLRAECMKKRVKIPESHAGKEMLCPICKDKLEKEWSNELEGFVWINAVKNSGTYIHATCAAEARAALSARQLSDRTRGTSHSPAPNSRQSTPQPVPRPIGESPLKPGAVKMEREASPADQEMDDAPSGVKRKIEEMGEVEETQVKKERL